ncbi:MAG: hypothetical protein WBG76_11420, partial [Ornithinimicrobium sp.]
ASPAAQNAIDPTTSARAERVMAGQNTALLVTAGIGLLLAVLLAIGWYLSYTAVRLDRLHTRLDATAAALEAQLVRRAQGAVDLAYEGVLDPASAALVLDAAQQTLQHTGLWTKQRAEAESSLTQILDVVAADLPQEQQSEIAERGMRVRLARTFHNEAVAITRSVREQSLVRWLHLAGHTDPPQRVEFVDRSDTVDGPSAT